MILKEWTKGDLNNLQALRQTFVDQYDHVRSIVPKEKLLEFKVEEGWKPLCEFLDKPIPKGEPYPNINNVDDYNSPKYVMGGHRYLWRENVKTAVKKVAVVTAVAAGIAAATLWYCI
jgi:hypothetical protein